MKAPTVYGDNARSQTAYTNIPAFYHPDSHRDNRAINYCGKKNTIGTRIRACRIKKGLSIKQLAALAGITPEGLSNIERRSSNNINITILSKISNALKEPISHLSSFESLPESTLQEKLLKAILFHGHTKLKAANKMQLSVKTIYNFQQRKYCTEETSQKFLQYIKEVNIQ
ncbi:helix-turn-helix domain-containing protein [uncultured Phascolarctobacterium sp.]|uniref:helix-turn-helix domain-containing protein n=1 Tax=uncultured Phascolarctobacterium sp. TaxID=512296 RepID=UPI00338F31FA